jgi:TrmH family RNA methyltransferase
VIESAQNRILKRYRSLEKRKTRDELELVPLEGMRLVRDAVERGVRLDAVLLAAGQETADLPFIAALEGQTRILTVDERLFSQTAFTESPQGILAIANRPKWTLADLFVKSPAFLLIVDGVQDPGNLGTMLRSAAAAGAGGAALLPGTVDAANPKALRSAMGAYFALPAVSVELESLLRELALRDIDLVVTGLETDTAYDDYNWTKPVAIAIGNEGAGISAAVKEAAAAQVSIPMTKDVESLNAAVAMSVISFEVSRQRRKRL